MGEQGENAADIAIEALPTTEEFIKDVDITAQVNSAIHADPVLSSFQINVTAMKGVITLSGSITSQDNIDKAVDVASAVDGVKDVKSKMVLK
jgi:osmotically-inducible protein OsmY